MILVAIGYLVLLASMWYVEWRRTARQSPDLLSIFLILFSVQLVLPGAIITSLLALYPDGLFTEIEFFDRVFRDVDALYASLVLLMSALFVLALYISWAVFNKIRFTLWTVGRPKPSISIGVSSSRWVAVMLIGLVSMWALLELLGGGLAGYQNLILLRANLIERTFATANLFSQTQSFAVLSIFGLLLYARKGSTLGFVFAVTCTIVFASMGVSRRALAIPLLLIYFTLILETKRYYFYRFVVPAALVFVPILMYGKELLAYVGASAEFDLEGFAFAALGLTGALRVASDVGISLVESWATLMYLDLPFRFGVDHLLSLARRFPEGLLGLDIAFPDRIVRISTEAFVGPEQDIPPGMIGQMWLDFGILGPAIWGIAFALQIGILQILFERVDRSPEGTAIFAVLVFIVALPINTGSYDFTFSVDIFALFLLMLGILRVGRRATPFASVRVHQLQAVQLQRTQVQAK